MTFADQQLFYGMVLSLHPEQQSFDVKYAHEAFDHIAGENLSVIELGGWDGALAYAMMQRGDIEVWVNYDLVRPAQVCDIPGYQFVKLEDYFWNLEPQSADVFVASHTIEHLTGEELEKLFSVLDVEYIYLDAPLPESGPVDWKGYEGSHVLELGWDEVSSMLSRNGYLWRCQGLWKRI
jgi:hypothetical protein